jgi:hypothetical protein
MYAQAVQSVRPVESTGGLMEGELRDQNLADIALV